MLLELTVDAPNAKEISEVRKTSAHKDLEKWLAGDHTSNNVYR